MEKRNKFVRDAIAQARNVHTKLKERGAFPQRPDAIPVFDPIHLVNPTNLVRVFSEDVVQLPIELKRPKGDIGHAANMQHFAEKIRIVCADKHNHCWARYLVCKELAHLLMYNPSGTNTHFTASFEDASKLIDELTNCRIDDFSDQALIDFTAWYAAIELLIPSEWLPKISEVRKQISEDPELRNQENKQIATALRVPEKILEVRLENPSVREFFE